MQSTLFSAIAHSILQAPTEVLSEPHNYKIILLNKLRKC